MNIKFVKGECWDIPEDAEVCITKYNSGKVVLKEFRYKKPKGSQKGKIKKNNRKNIDEYKSKKNINRSIKCKIRPLLENNFNGGKSEIFVTLTYSKNMDNFKQLVPDFDNFWKRITRKYKNRYRLACVYVKEMQQKRNSWHIHALIKDLDGNKLYIPNETMGLIWKNGFTSVSRVLSGFDLDYRQMNEEKKMEENFFIQNERWNIKKIIDYMCKLKTKEGYIPSNGKLYGTKGGLRMPHKEVGIYKDFIQENEKNLRITDDEMLKIIDKETNCIINHIHTQTFIEQNKKK